MQKYLFIFLIIFLTGVLTNAQWEAGTSFNYKNTVPEKGAGLRISRNLPFQSPALGIKTSILLNYFSGKTTIQGIQNEISFTSTDIGMGITADFFFRTFQPFAGIITGFDILRANGLNANSLFIGANAGVQLIITYEIRLFMEYSLINRFKRYSDIILKDVQVLQSRGSLGVIVKI